MQLASQRVKPLFSLHRGESQQAPWATGNEGRALGLSAQGTGRTDKGVQGRALRQLPPRSSPALPCISSCVASGKSLPPLGLVSCSNKHVWLLEEVKPSSSQRPRPPPPSPPHTQLISSRRAEASVEGGCSQCQQSGNHCLLWFLPINAEVCGWVRLRPPQKGL